MTDRDLRAAVARGQGRAILFLRENGGDAYRDLILELCCRNQAFDTQFEDRSDYMARLVDTLSTPENLVPALGAQLLNSRDCKSRWQIRRVLAHLREKGSSEARDFLRHDFHRFRLADRSFAHSVELLGWEGLELTIKHARRLDVWELGCQFDATVELFGAEVALRAFWTLPEPQRLETLSCRCRSRYAQRPSVEADQLLAEVRKGVALRASGLRLVATHAQFKELARLGIETTDHAVLRAVLRATRGKAWPLDVEVDFALSSEEADLGLRRLRLLLFESTNHSSIRAWAINRLREKPKPQELEGAIGLLRVNAAPDDIPVMLSALRRLRNSRLAFHGAGLDIMELGCGPSVELLNEVYEFGPCDECRGSAFGRLKALAALTPSQIEECLEDSNEYVRGTARGLLRQ